MPNKKKYMTQNEWEEWKDNDWLHFCMKVVRLEAIQYVLLALVLGILGLILKLAFGG